MPQDLPLTRSRHRVMLRVRHPGSHAPRAAASVALSPVTKGTSENAPRSKNAAVWAIIIRQRAVFAGQPWQAPIRTPCGIRWSSCQRSNRWWRNTGCTVPLSRHCQRAADTQPCRASGAPASDTLSRWHDPYRDVTPRVHATPGRAGSPSKAQPHPLPRRAPPNAKLRSEIIPGNKKNKSKVSDTNDDVPHPPASVRIS